jgi:hypothetical protein
MYERIGAPAMPKPFSEGLMALFVVIYDEDSTHDRPLTGLVELV